MDRLTDKRFRQFALKLKREGLWNRFRILQYYFRIFDIEKGNKLMTLYRALKEPEVFEVVNKSGYTVFEHEHFIPVSEIFKYYRV